MIPVVALGAVILLALALSGGKARAAERPPDGPAQPFVPPAPRSDLPPRPKPAPPKPPAKPPKPPPKVVEAARDMAKGTATARQMREAADEADAAGLGGAARVMRKTADAATELSGQSRRGKKVPGKVKQALKGKRQKGEAKPRAKDYREAAVEAKAAGLPATADLLNERAAVAEEAERATEGGDPRAGPAPPDWVDAVLPTHDLLRDTLIKLAYARSVSSAQLRAAAGEARTLAPGIVAPLALTADATDEMAAAPEVLTEALPPELISSAASDPQAAQRLRQLGFPATAALAEWQAA